MLREKEKREIENKVTIMGEQITDKAESYVKHAPFTKLGLCGEDCENLHAHETEYGTIYAFCSLFKRPLKADDPVKRCTCYWKASSPSLKMMIQIAYLIDKKEQIGFIPDKYDEEE